MLKYEQHFNTVLLTILKMRAHFVRPCNTFEKEAEKMVKKYISDLKNEFKGYNVSRLTKDIMAGLTVCAVALPLAIAFGVGSGADAAAGLITAILSGIVMSLLSGASFQISGPTGAMTAVLMVIVAKHGLNGVFTASLIAGIIILICGIFKLGKLVKLIPMPVVTGFTSGIAIIIAMGQIDNFFGTVSKGETALEKIASYGTLGFSPNIQAVICGLLVIAIMVVYPKKWNAKVPSSLVSIIVVGLISYFLKFDVAKVGDIPRTLLPENRLILSAVNFESLTSLISPAITIAALGMIESLLCGASASRMKNEPFDADRELVAQGIGNVIIPFFGGVPSTAAIARTSVAIKSGCETRLCGVFHSLALLASMFLLGPVMAQLPLSALAGVLMVTAWRMNEWHMIKEFFKKKMPGAISKFLITMVATVVFDLTVAIIIGIVYSLILFVFKVSRLSIETQLDGEKAVIKLSGVLAFVTVPKLKTLNIPQKVTHIVFDISAISAVDTSGVYALNDIVEEIKAQDIDVTVENVAESQKAFFAKSGVIA